MGDTLDEIIFQVTMTYMNGPGPNTTVTIKKMKDDLIELINDYIEMRNAAISNKSRKYKYISILPNAVVSQIILKVYHVMNIRLFGGSTELAVYCDSGKNEGLYVTDRRIIKQIIKPASPLASEHDIKEIISDLECYAPEVELTKDKDLIAVNNGIFDYRSKTLLPFSPEMVFLSKSRVDYVPSAKNVVIHNPDDGTDWDVESWMESLSGDPEIVRLLWELLGAVIRPNVPWNKSAWMYAASGNNGKGTLCELMRNLCGKENCASIKLSQFSNDVFLDSLVQVSAIINDENQPNSYVEVADTLKCLITGDPVTINRKYRSKLSFTFRGMVVQCFNEFPKIRDRTTSLLRRLLIIPMENCFEGCERKYIKNEYIKRKDVLEYVLYRVLNMDYYELSIPKACRNALAKYQEFNNPVVEFWNRFRDEFVWDLLPFQFLYDLYKAWHVQFYPSGKLLSYQIFCADVRTAAAGDPVWEAKNYSVAPGRRLDKGEPLVGEYGLKDWMDGTYSGTDINKKYRPLLKTTYRGFVRMASVITCGGTAAMDDENEEGVK